MLFRSDDDLLYFGASLDANIGFDGTNFNINTGSNSTVINSGNVGIGTSTPYATLAIDNNAGENAFFIGSSTALALSTSFIVDHEGNVGIGTGSPSEALDLSSGNLVTTGLGTFGNLDVDTLNLDGNTISDSTGVIAIPDRVSQTVSSSDASDNIGLDINLDRKSTRLNSSHSSVSRMPSSA